MFAGILLDVNPHNVLRVLDLEGGVEEKLEGPRWTRRRIRRRWRRRRIVLQELGPSFPSVGTTK